MIGTYAIGEVPIGEVPYLSSSFIDAALKPVADRCYALELEVSPTKNVGAAFDGTIGDWPIGDQLAATNVPTLSGFQYFSDRGYTSKPSDMLPNTHFEGRAKTPLTIVRSIPLSPERSNRLNMQIGNVVIDNTDGALDNISQNYAVDGRVLRVKLGLESASYDDFQTIFEGRSANWTDDETEVNISVLDPSYSLAKIPLQNQLYAGTGGAEGASNIAGQPKPLVFGQVLNITPVQLDPANNIYQFTARQAQAVNAVYDSGVSITASGTNYATYALLAAASVTPGQYATCLALGMFKTGSNPVGAITADVQGDALGSYVSTGGAIAKRILTDFGSVALSQISGAFDALAVTDPAIIGWYSQSQTLSVADAMTQIMAGVIANWGTDRIGNYTCYVLSEPDANNLTADFDSIDILDVQQVALPEELDPPRWRQRLGYAINWTPQQGTDLAGSVTTARRQYLAQDVRVVTAQDTTIQGLYLLAQDSVITNTLYLNQADAQARCNALLALHKVRRQFLQLSMKTQGHLLELSKSLRFTWPRSGLSNGKVFVIAGIEENCKERRCEITVWG